MNQKLLILALASLLVGAGLAMALFLWSKNNQVTRVQTSGVADIGGAFKLTNHRGQPVTEKTLLGRYTLVFFGFTTCPDICPVALQNITAALEMMGSDGDRITPVFITTDPERDTVEKVAAFVKGFHEKLIGLTGTPEQVKIVAQAYRIYYSKAMNKDAPDGYSIDHSSVIYLMGRDGKYITHFRHTTTAKDMARRINLILEHIDKSS